jgi:hypothetical protein
LPLGFPIYQRCLKGASSRAKTLSPRLNIALAILFAVVAVVHAIQVPELLRNRKDFWDLTFHVATASVWLIMSIEYFRRATKEQPTPPVT